jgi:ferredoxin-thioredoxin reductase catalytic subunit
MSRVILNPDKEVVELIREGLRRTGGYCPCLTTKNEDTKCMCKAFREQEEGKCLCGLFIKIREE